MTLGIISVPNVVCIIHIIRLFIIGKTVTDEILGTPLFGRKVDSNGEPGEVTIVRAGIFDDKILNAWKPVAEIYTDRRLEWLGPLEGTGQFCGMLPMP